MNLVDVVNKKYARTDLSELAVFKAGDSVAVSVRITEGNKTRVQLFEGTVIALKGNRNTPGGHFRVRKISSGYGVERVFPFHSPNVVSVKVLKHGKVRRAKHYYLRDRTGKAARIETDYSVKNTAK